MNIPMLRDLNDKVDEIVMKYPDATIGELLAGLVAVTLAAAKQANEVEFAGAAWDKAFEVVKSTDIASLMSRGSLSN